MENKRKEQLLKTLGLTEKQARIFLKSLASHAPTALGDLEFFNLTPAAKRFLTQKVMASPRIFLELAEELGHSPKEIARLKDSFGI